MTFKQVQHWAKARHLILEAPTFPGAKLTAYVKGLNVREQRSGQTAWRIDRRYRFLAARPHNLRIWRAALVTMQGETRQLFCWPTWKRSNYSTREVYQRRKRAAQAVEKKLARRSGRRRNG